jgi:hypothetical protein
MRGLPVCRVLAAAVLALPAVVAPTATATAGAAQVGGSPQPVAVPAAAAELVIQLASLTPAVARSGQDVVITGTLRNDTAAPLARPTVRVVQGTISSSRKAVRDWAAGTGPASGEVLAQTRIAGTVGVGAAATFRITMKDLASHGPATYGALPLSIESGAASVRTFAGYERLKQYQPMSIAWAVPLTVDPDPDLFGATGDAREAAWNQALAPGSRLSRVLDATQDAPVTWAIDPTLTPGLLPDSVDGGQKATRELALRTATEARITKAAASHTPWILADTDADLGAVAGGASGEGLMRSLVERAATVAEALGGRGDVAWPADGSYTTSAETGLRGLFRVPALAGQVTSASVLRAGPGNASPVAAQRSLTGLPLLAYDDQLSGLLARTTSAAEAALSTQQFIAESVALLNELPGTQGRTVFVVAPRSYNPDPQGAKSFFAAAGSIPWLSGTSTDAELATARRSVPTPAAPVTRPTVPSTSSGQPVLTAPRIRQLQDTVRTVRGVAQIRDDGDQFQRTWSRAAEQLASTRWRASATAWDTLSGRVSAAARQTTTAVKVSASTVNFLADSGRLQITVTNDLTVPVENVKLTVEASNPRLRIDSQPSILRIGPRSRATVNVSVTALAAGLVPLRTTLTTPDGTVIGQGADVQVRVTPTGDWVYWVLGGVAVAVLVLGIVRSLRRRPGPTTPTTTPVEAHR